MKLDNIKLNNFCKFTKLEIEFDSKITRLCGLNGAGKTSILVALWAGIKGIADRAKTGQMPGERFRFIGDNKKSSDIEITLIDEKNKNKIIIKNHITNNGNSITFESQDGTQISEKWVNEFFNVSFLSAKHFCELSSQQQAIELGINTKSFDDELKHAKTEFTLINRDLKNLGNVAEVEKVDEADINDIWKEKEKLRIFNEEQDKFKEAIENKEDFIGNIEIDIKDLEKRLLDAKEALNSEMQKYKNLPQPQSKRSTEEIDQKISSAKEINKKAEAYKLYLKNKEKQDKIKSLLDKNKELQKDIETRRIEYIKQKNLPFSDLSIDDAGGLLLKGRPIASQYFSKGELEIVVAKLFALCQGDDALKMRFIDDFDLLDNERGKNLVESLINDGFQIITAEVGEKKGENVIILRECKIVEEGKREVENLI